MYATRLAIIIPTLMQRINPQDDKKTMTYGRRIALKLSKYSWYNPQLKTEQQQQGSYSKVVEEEDTAEKAQTRTRARARAQEKPSIAKAWAYFEHMTLPRHKYHHDHRSGSGMTTTPKDEPSFLRSSWQKVFQGDRTLECAVSGEDNYETTLYHPITTPLHQMGDFGLGVGLYFSTLKAIIIMMGLATLMNIPNFLYFSSAEYSRRQEGVRWFLKGSAVCNVQEWVPCVTCQPEDFEDYRFQTTVDGQGRLKLNFVLRNACNGAIFRVGMVNFGTTVLVMVGMIVMTIYLRRKEVEFDEDEQTAQDYSIVVRNPPHDAVKPEEWREFFTNNFHGVHITCCTVAVDNDALVHALVARRELLKNIDESLSDEEEDDVSVENLRKISEKIVQERGIVQKIVAKLFGGIPAMYEKLVDLNGKIVELSQQSYPASR